MSVDEIRDDAPRLHLKLLRAIPMVIVLGLLVHFLLPRLGTIEDSLKLVRHLRPVALTLAVVMETLSYVANGLLLQQVVCLAQDRVSLRRAVAIEAGASTVALVAAGALGFGAAIYKWLRGSRVSVDAAMLSTWLPPVFDSTALILFAIASGIELLIAHQLSRTTEVALAVVVSVLTAVIVLAIALLARDAWRIAISQRVARLVKRVHPKWDASGFLDAAERASQMWHRIRLGGWIRPAAASVMVLTFDLLCLRYAFIAAGHPLHFSLLLGGYGVPILLGRASFLPGGIAVTELTMAALFGGLGVPASTAVVAVLTYRLISFWLPSLIGAPIAITLQSSKAKAE
jgi:uncharacterized protein (TIRG00374 family)